ncbi:phage tail protein [Nocardioides sp. TF02-7]|uniref:phage tail protein n=1 Tax=Nocardioides sp. TF02-7 TaxID=2917724 RepID=UPI001F05B7B1|nr:phage tail protein [Nocardioides sp. TF02-7]UMG91025.1 phage tail protein [Nocardioides sp. TF02-7]
MPNSLINTDPMVSQNFFLEVDGGAITILSSVSGLDLEVDVVSTEQVGPGGKVQVVKTVGTATKAPDLQLVRMAPPDMSQDQVWSWFNTIRDKGIKLGDRSDQRKNGSIVLYDSTNTEISRFNFTNGWPSKIATDQLSVESNDVVKGDDHARRRDARPGQVSGLRTAYEFTLPRGYVDDDGRVHRTGTMRLATARDELEPLRDPRISGPDDPRLTVLVLSRVITGLGDLPMVTMHEVEGALRRRPRLPAGLLRRHQLRQPGGVRRTRAGAGHDPARR